MPTQFLPFLTELSHHNTKQWMDDNRDWYLQAREYFLEDVAWMLAEFSVWEPGFSSFQAKDCMFRQNRDIRFSANKDPYKTNFAAYFSLGGKKSKGPGYYVHLQPGQSFIAGGVWMPEPDVLKKIRQEIDYAGRELEDILEKPAFKKLFRGLDGEKLKNNPKGFDPTHPFIDLLKYKSYIVSTPLSDEDVETGLYKEKAMQGFRMIKPLHDFLVKALDNADSGEGILG